MAKNITAHSLAPDTDLTSCKLSRFNEHDRRTGRPTCPLGPVHGGLFTLAVHPGEPHSGLSIWVRNAMAKAVMWDRQPFWTPRFTSFSYPATCGYPISTTSPGACPVARHPPSHRPTMSGTNKYGWDCCNVPDPEILGPVLPDCKGRQAWRHIHVQKHSLPARQTSPRSPRPSDEVLVPRRTTSEMDGRLGGNVSPRRCWTYGEALENPYVSEIEMTASDQLAHSSP